MKKKSNGLQMTFIRLRASSLERLREVAERNGIKRATLLRMIIENALEGDVKVTVRQAVVELSHSTDEG